MSLVFTPNHTTTNTDIHSQVQGDHDIIAKIVDFEETSEEETLLFMIGVRLRMKRMTRGCESGLL
jgi:hypothetical protein